MNNILIKIETKNDQQLVSARELYSFLEISERFSAWFERMLAYGFVEDIDYASVKSFTLVNNGAERELQDYHIKLDMAKEISMIQRSEKGKQARLCFIEAEKQLKTLTIIPSYQIENAVKRAERWIEEYKEKEALQIENDELKPKAEILKRIESKEGLHSIRNTAKLLQFPERKFIEFCLTNKILFRDFNKQLIGFADKVNSNICFLKIIELSDRVLTQTLFTNSGISWLAQYIAKWQKKTNQNLKV